MQDEVPARVREGGPLDRGIDDVDTRVPERPCRAGDEGLAVEEGVGKRPAALVQNETEAPGNLVPGASVDVVAAQEASASSRMASALSSLVFSASASSETRI